jgi:DNA repair exonuclease SbcCD ATPase subunit
MSKELINEIESKIAWNDMNIDETSISLRDVKRLLNELEEQAERVEELEMKLSINTNNMKQLQKENERYKQALEEIRGLYPLRNVGYQVSEIIMMCKKG